MAPTGPVGARRGGVRHRALGLRAALLPLGFGVQPHDHHVPGQRPVPLLEHGGEGEDMRQRSVVRCPQQPKESEYNFSLMIFLPFKKFLEYVPGGGEGP